MTVGADPELTIANNGWRHAVFCSGCQAREHVSGSLNAEVRTRDSFVAAQH
jgi:hypothetical protein